MSLFDLPLGDAPVWSIVEEEVETSAPQGQEERIVSVLPAWTAQTDLDLYAQHVTPSGPVQTRSGGIAASHHDGQTFVTWTCPQGVGWTYRVYASPSPIVDGPSLAAATLLGTLGDSTWYDRRLSTILGAPLARVRGMSGALARRNAARPSGAACETRPGGTALPSAQTAISA